MEHSAQFCIATMYQTLKNKAARLLDPIAQAQGLTQLQACVLLYLYQGEATVGDISELTGMGQANTSALCKKLEQAGFLMRKRGSGDGRVVTLSLTPKGQASIEGFQRGVGRHLAKLDGLDPQLRKDFLRGVRAAEQILDYLYAQAIPAGGGDHETKGE